MQLQRTELAPAPAEISLVDEGTGAVYRQSSDSLRLYTCDKDPPGRSVCDQSCASAWPPVYAPPAAHPVGDWSIVERPDGKRQWALKGRPVYTHVHDAPGQAIGEAVPGWRLLQYTP